MLVPLFKWNHGCVNIATLEVGLGSDDTPTRNMLRMLFHRSSVGTIRYACFLICYLCGQNRTLHHSNRTVTELSRTMKEIIILMAYCAYVLVRNIFFLTVFVYIYMRLFEST